MQTNISEPERNAIVFDHNKIYFKNTYQVSRHRVSERLEQNGLPLYAQQDVQNLHGEARKAKESPDNFYCRNHF